MLLFLEMLNSQYEQNKKAFFGFSTCCPMSRGLCYRFYHSRGITKNVTDLTTPGSITEESN